MKLRRRPGIRSFACLLALVAGGCSYLKWQKDRKAWLGQLEQAPSLALARKAAPEDCFALVGGIAFPSGHYRQVLVVAFDHAGTGHELVASREVTAETGFYLLLLPAGLYDVAVLADRNGDGLYAADEVVGSTDPMLPVRVAPEASSDGFVIKSPEIAVEFDRPRSAEAPIRLPVHSKPFVVATVDDPLFAPEYGTLGVYYPTRFLTHSQSLVFAVGDPDPTLPLVLLVHGLDGTPRDFRELIASLDPSKYGILVFNYPSGMPIEKMGATLAFVLREIARRSPDNLRLALVAHSMGGLVARRALNEVCQGGRPDWLRLYATFVTPWGGSDSAERGIRGGRELVASWRDVATGSAFLTGLYATPLPNDLAFYLFFGWGSAESRGPNPAGDGTIAMRSQLDPRVQSSATKLLGFEQTHVGILSDPAALQALNATLDKTLR